MSDTEENRGKDIDSGKSRIRAWVFTLNNYTKDEVKHIESLINEKRVRYIVCGREVGEQGTKHLQGYIYLNNAATFTSVKKLLGTERVYIAQAKGNAKQNRKYCTKDNDYIEHGNMPEQGKRTDLIELKDQILNGEKTVDEICVENPMAIHQYERTLKRLEDIYLRTRYRTQMTTCD